MVHYHEKEIKLRVEDFDSITDALKKNNAKFLGSAFQRTVRFDTEAGELEKQGLFLRTRSGFKDVVTLKIKVDNPEVHERKEIEIPIDDVGRMGTILRELGFSRERIMEKRRSLWSLDRVEICLDELPFGLFVEFEGEEDAIFTVAKKLGLDTSDKITTTYWDVFEEFKRETGGKGDDIVFDSG